MNTRLLVLLGSALTFASFASAQLNVTGNVSASQVTSGTFSISLIPTGTSSTTVAIGNDSRFLNATSLNGTSISSLTGILKLTSGTPSNAAASDLIALWSGTCSSSTFLRGDGTCATPGGGGTVTSVGLTTPTFFSVAGSPVTSSGTLAVSYATGLTSNENQVLGVNASGAAGLLAITGAMLPNPSSSTLGGVQSAAAVSHQWINSISTSGVPALSQPAFTDISGSVAATQLPNPGASTLGGIESYAGVSHQWINSISTSGVPSSTQPAFSDISGSAAASQMPTNVQVWNKYTIGFASVQTAATTNAVTVVSLSAKQAVCGVFEKTTTAFAGTSITGLTATIGDSNGTATTYSPVAYNLLQTVSNTAFVANNVLGMASYAGGTIQANFTATGANLSALTAGSLDVTVCTFTLP
jgi:hypothetical protein